MHQCLSIYVMLAWFKPKGSCNIDNGRHHYHSSFHNNIVICDYKHVVWGNLWNRDFELEVRVVKRNVWFWYWSYKGYSIESWTLARRCPTRVALRAGVVSSSIASFPLCRTTFLFYSRPLLSMFHTTSRIQLLTKYCHYTTSLYSNFI